MRGLVWTATGLVAALWSSFAWILVKLLDFGGRTMAGSFGALPLKPAAADLFASFTLAGTGLAGWIVGAVWLVVLLAITLVGLFIDGSIPRPIRPI
jgi:hypothetical protein